MSFDALIFISHLNYLDFLRHCRDLLTNNYSVRMSHQYAFFEARRQASLLIGFGCDKV